LLIVGVGWHNEYCDWAEGCKQRSIGSIPGKGKRGIPLLQTMKIGYGAHRAYYSMGAGDKAAGA
jgi:hypothetical protein